MTISSTAPPEPAQTSLSLSEEPLRSRTSSGFAAACIVSGNITAGVATSSDKSV